MRLPNPKEPPIATLRIPIVKPAAEAAPDSAAPADAASPANSAASTATPPADSTTPPASPAPAATDAAAAAPAEAEEEVKTVKLRVPLMIYYVKNGETLLARLPVVVGLSPVVTAEVPDDSRRLQAEGLLKGLQSEVVDVVASRQVAAARVRMRIDERKLDLAKEMLEELRKVNGLRQHGSRTRRHSKKSFSTKMAEPSLLLLKCASRGCSSKPVSCCKNICRTIW
jgi:hypothetical protein